MWNQAKQALLERFAAKFGLPIGDDHARSWTRMLAEQFAFTFPAQEWGTKRGSPTRPPSTDVICTRFPFIGYDVIISQGQPNQSLAYNPEPIDLTGQVFIEVSATDHLGAAPVEPPVPPSPCPECPKVFGYPDENTIVKHYQDRVRATYAEAGRAFPDPRDADAFRWFTRYGYSCHSMPEPEAADKHIKELRSALGLL